MQRFAATAVMGRRAGSGSSGDGDDDWGTRTNGVYCEQSTGEVMRGEAVTGRWVAGAAWRVSVTVVGRGSEEGALELRVRSRWGCAADESALEMRGALEISVHSR